MSQSVSLCSRARSMVCHVVLTSLFLTHCTSEMNHTPTALRSDPALSGHELLLNKLWNMRHHAPSSRRAGWELFVAQVHQQLLSPSSQSDAETLRQFFNKLSYEDKQGIGMVLCETLTAGGLTCTSAASFIALLASKYRESRSGSTDDALSYKGSDQIDEQFTPSLARSYSTIAQEVGASSTPTPEIVGTFGLLTAVILVGLLVVACQVTPAPNQPEAVPAPPASFPSSTPYPIDEQDYLAIQEACPLDPAKATPYVDSMSETAENTQISWINDCGPEAGSADRLFYLSASAFALFPDRLSQGTRAVVFSGSRIRGFLVTATAAATALGNSVTAVASSISAALASPVGIAVVAGVTIVTIVLVFPPSLEDPFLQESVAQRYPDVMMSAVGSTALPEEYYDDGTSAERRRELLAELAQALASEGVLVNGQPPNITPTPDPNRGQCLDLVTKAGKDLADDALSMTLGNPTKLFGTDPAGTFLNISGYGLIGSSQVGRFLELFIGSGAARVPSSKGGIETVGEGAICKMLMAMAQCAKEIGAKYLRVKAAFANSDFARKLRLNYGAPHKEDVYSVYTIPVDPFKCEDGLSGTVFSRYGLWYLD